MQPDIKVKNLQDWSSLSEKKIDTIIDPMIVRSADLWLQGRAGVESGNSEEVWAALSQNIDSIEAFFDTLVLSERVPLIDYGITFDSNIGFEPKSLYKRINALADEKLMLNVHVMGEASKIARTSVQEAFEKGRSFSTPLAKDIIGELSTYDHKWYPDLAFLGSELTEEETNVARFRYGLLLFGHFASMAKTGHLIQSKRARFFTAGSVGAKRASYELEPELRNELKNS